MPPKRKAEDETKSRKRARMSNRDARNIQVQKSKGRQDARAKLPESVNVEDLVESRAFEVLAMENSMRSAKHAGAQRAFQSLPRHLRRRAASHDLRRLPTRLRAKAAREMANDKHTGPKKRKLRDLPYKKKVKMIKSRHLSYKEKILARKIAKGWLETHVWHAKRMKMVELWGRRIAMTPTEKCFRPSYRAAQHGCIAHDASYTDTTTFTWTLAEFKATFAKVCDPTEVSPTAVRYLSGARVCTSTIYVLHEFPFNMLGPARFVWDPLPAGTKIDDQTVYTVTVFTHPSITVPVIDTIAAAVQTTRTRLAEKAIQEASQITQDLYNLVSRASSDMTNEQHRQALRDENFDPDLLQLGNTPATQLAMQEAIKQTISCKRAFAKSDSATQKVQAYKTQARQPVVFELMGPESGSVLYKLLRPVLGTAVDKLEFLKAASEQGPSAVGEGMVVRMEVYDPRLSFPPRKNANIHHDPKAKILGSTDLYQAEKTVFSKEPPKFSKLALDKRRNENSKEGGGLRPEADDDRIPILIYRRDISTSTSKDQHPISGFTLVVPQGWGMPFWSSIAFCSVRIGGQREMAQQSFEAGQPCFPQDYLLTQPGLEMWRRIGEIWKETWERKPPAKRVNYAKIGTEHPWNLTPAVFLARQPFGLSKPPILLQGRMLLDFLQKCDKLDHSGPVDEQRSKAFWMLCVNAINNKSGLPNDWPHKNSQQFLDSLDYVSVMARLTPVGKGSPEDMAMVFHLNAEDWYKWSAMLGDQLGKKKGQVEEIDYEEDLLLDDNKVPMGLVTSGNFSLKRARGFGICTISLESLLEIRARDKDLPQKSPLRNLVVFKNRDTRILRFATLEIIV